MELFAKIVYGYWKPLTIFTENSISVVSQGFEYNFISARNVLLGLLERPVEILSRKRDRKSTERYIDKSSEKPKSTEDELDYSKVW